jgi:hypothetical protein
MVLGGAQSAAEEQDLKTSFARVPADEIAATGAVADEEIRHPKREAIEGAGGRHPGVEIARATQILDRRLRATADHFEHQATPAGAESSRAR